MQKIQCIYCDFIENFAQNADTKDIQRAGWKLLGYRLPENSIYWLCKPCNGKTLKHEQ